MSTKDGPALIYRCEVARLMGRDPRTIARLAAVGELPTPLKFGRNLAWRRAELLSFLGLSEAAPLASSGAGL